MCILDVPRTKPKGQGCLAFTVDPAVLFNILPIYIKYIQYLNFKTLGAVKESALLRHSTQAELDDFIYLYFCNIWGFLLFLFIYLLLSNL